MGVVETVAVVMLTTDRASPDGVRVATYVEGEEYQVPRDLAEAWFARDVARLASEPPAVTRRRKAKPKASPPPEPPPEPPADEVGDEDDEGDDEGDA